MTAPLNVLVYGSVENGVCDWYRFGMHVDTLRAEGVELRALTTVSYRAGEGRGFLDAGEDEDFTLDRADLDWADVVVFRRFYQTVWACKACPHANGTKAEVAAHARETGHPMQPPDPIVRPLLRALDRDPSLLRGRAVVYETDDDLLDIQAWNGVRHRVAQERDLIEHLIRRADLVTTTTPVLAERLGAWNDEVRVVRNAVDLGLYHVDPAELPPVEGDPRVLYYGAPVRYRDYVVAKDAVDAAKREVPSLRRVWLGGRNAPYALERDPRVEGSSDEVLPYVAGVAPFARALALAQPHIGLAPLLGDRFDRAKSELHWLEYAAAGAATIATVTDEPGPFDVIRDGVDGLVARDAAGWHDAMHRLATSKTLREELAGRARERVEREYDVRVRAHDWAEAYRWAALHAGRGQRPASAPGWREDDIVERGTRALAYRRRTRDAGAAAPARLEAVRARLAAEPVRPQPPLVSILVPVGDEPAALVTRAVGSALAQTYRPLEVVVAHAPDRTPPPFPVVDGVRLVTVAVADASHAAIAADLRDALPLTALVAEPATRDETLARAAGDELAGRLLRAAADAATGSWIAPLSPEGELDPEHVETLVGVATEYDLEFVYARTYVDLGAGAQMTLGAWPPGPDVVLTLGTELYAAALRDVAGYDPEAWRDDEAVGWAHWRRLAVAGVRMANIELVLHRLTVLPGAA